VNLANRYYQFPHTPSGVRAQQLCRIELGGTPRQVPNAYRIRSPITYARRIARSHVPLELWWSINDRVIPNQATQAGGFYRRLMHDDPEAPVLAVAGSWPHAAVASASFRLPYALARIGLMSHFWLTHTLYRWHTRRSSWQPRGSHLPILAAPPTDAEPGLGHA
jgi:hypothetical protein